MYWCGSNVFASAVTIASTFCWGEIANPESVRIGGVYVFVDVMALAKCHRELSLTLRLVGLLVQVSFLKMEIFSLMIHLNELIVVSRCGVCVSLYLLINLFLSIMRLLISGEIWLLQGVGMTFGMAEWVAS